MRSGRRSARLAACSRPSKSEYAAAHPDHVCVFNANVCLRGGKLWWGDVDLTTPEQQLRELARLTGETACLLHERDGRFRPEDAPALERALHSVAAEGQTGWDEELSFRAWRRDVERR